jgi:hypothetical protein
VLALRNAALYVLLVEVAIFLGRCNSCGSQFAVPLLADQSYGEFIARGELGRAAAYLNSFEEPAWSEIASICEEFITLSEAKHTWSPAVRAFHYIVSRCIDHVDGEALWIDGRSACPACGASDVAYGDTAKVGTVALPNAAFSCFQRLTTWQQRDRVAELLAEWQAAEQRTPHG